MQKELMPASEARRIVENAEDEKTTRIWNEIVDKVNRAIQDGEKCYTSDGSLPQSLIKKLQALGYKAYNGEQYNQDYYVISWKEAK